MRAGIAVGGAVALAACSSSPGGDSSVHPGLGTEPEGNVLSYVEGSFDPSKGALELVFRRPTGEIMTEATLPYGTAPGDTYLHTCGTHGDGFTNSTFAPPSVQSSSLVEFEFAPNNGTGAAISNFVLNVDSVTPSSVLVDSDPGVSGGTCGHSGGGVAAPCTITWTLNPVPVTATFPISNAATCSSGGVRGVFNAGAIGGGPFSFAAHLTGN